MKKVTFQKLSITNFKGIKSLEIDFSNDTIIKGDNGTGKSTVFDAMTWCLFGKNSQNDTDFGIKNTVNTELNRADHVVELTIMVDDAEVKAKCIYREKWTKRQGTDQTVFTGHETLYFWNNVPCSKKEYQAKVDEVIPEQLFKLLTNPLYFNVNLKENDRRDTLVKMAGDIPNERIINGTPMFQELFAKLKGQKTLEEYRKEIAHEKSGLKKALAEIGPRIDEILRGIPKEQNWKDLENEVAQKQKAIREIDAEIAGLSSTFEASNKEATRIHNEVLQAGREMSRIEMKLRGEAENEASKANMHIRNAQFELSQIQEHIKTNRSRLKEYSEMITDTQNIVANLRQEWQDENVKVFSFDESLCICPTCKRELETSDIEKTRQELETSFNEAKQRKLSNISIQGAAQNKHISQVTESINTLGNQTAELLHKEEQLLVSGSLALIQPAPIDLESHAEYQSMKKLSEQTIPAVETIDITDQNEIKQVLQDGINELNNLLAARTTINQNNARIEELKADEKRFSKDLADLEKSDFAIESFQKKRMEMVEQAVNDKFKIARFKLFKSLVNGGEEACCETMVNRVPFSDLNHAAQLNVGIDIANTLSQFYGVSAPIVIDNAESTNSFIETDSQLIRLYVTLDKELTIA